jgi:hypothetical protein
MSNVRPRADRMECMAHTTDAHRTVALAQVRCVGSLINSAEQLVQPGRNGARVRSTKVSSLKPSRNAQVYSSKVLSAKQSTKVHCTRAGARSASPRSCVSLPLRSAGALGHEVKSKLKVVATVVPSSVRPNPSVDGTHNGGARLFASSRSAAPLCAPHLKR